MCWTSKTTNVIKQVARKPIIVRKIMRKTHDNEIYSPYQNYRYFRFIPYFTKLEITRYFNRTEISKGFHSYSPECNIIHNDGLSVDVFHDGRIITSYSASACKYVIKKFLIPPGATYYENERGQIVSNCIIML